MRGLVVCFVCVSEWSFFVSSLSNYPQIQKIGRFINHDSFQNLQEMVFLFWVYALSRGGEIRQLSTDQYNFQDRSFV